jgi:hypothetical protein
MYPITSLLVCGFFSNNIRSTYQFPRVTLHNGTNIAVVQPFPDCKIDHVDRGGDVGESKVGHVLEDV